MGEAPRKLASALLGLDADEPLKVLEFSMEKTLAFRALFFFFTAPDGADISLLID